MVDPYATGGPGFDGARLTTRTAARTVTVDPAKGPDFEMPFRCGEAWVGSTRSSHSPSRYSIDFNRTGDTGRPVLSSAPGVVYRVAKASGYGNYVIVDHGAGYSTLYAHLQATHVSVGQVVDQSAVVGFVGSTGRVTGPHLHFEQRLNGNYFAPYFHRTRFVFDRTVSSQSCADTPLVGDWDGDGTDNVAVFRRTTGLGTTFQNTPAGSRVIRYGAPGYTPFTGDWDGNGITQLGSRAARSTAFQLRGEDGRTSQANMGGSIKDTPISGTWVRSAKSSIGVYSHLTRKFTLRYRGQAMEVCMNLSLARRYA
ncbi:MAG: M23 family metallopeptidase, partial [Myxococcaceae bacterium]